MELSHEREKACEENRERIKRLMGRLITDPNHIPFETTDDDGAVEGKNQMSTITPKTRIEVIDQTTTGTGREYTKWVSEEFTVTLEEQDSGRTLKIFLEDVEEQTNE